MNKILFCATVRSHIGQFHQPYLQFFKEQGYEVHVAARNNSHEKPLQIQGVDVFHDVCFSRSPMHPSNLQAYRQLRCLITDHKYSLIHCHTPMGGVIARLAAARERTNRPVVMYTAHGFHFHKGAPIMNWLIYLPIEKFLARYTDVLILINQEDFETAKKYKMHARSIQHIRGVGVDLDSFTPPTPLKRQEIRKRLGLSQNSFVIVYIAELTYRKHQDLAIHAMHAIRHHIPEARLLLVGSGPLLDKYTGIVNSLNLASNVYFLGYRRDIADILQASDVAISTSRREGLPLNIMEAMATGLPIIATDCRGNRDLVEPGRNGVIVGINNVDECVSALVSIYKVPSFRTELGMRSVDMVRCYSLSEVLPVMKELYIKALEGRLCDTSL